MKLQEWTQIFLKQRDILKKEIAEIIEKDDEHLIISYTNGTQHVAITGKKLLVECLEEHPLYISILNSKENVTTLAHNWKKFAAEKQLTIIFVEPKKNEKWLIKPHLHEKISEDEALVPGLMSMHESIPTA